MRLQQIIGNLVSNAVKYTSHGHIGVIVSFQQIDTVASGDAA
jgi:signal transduction histidine kinase